MNFENSEFLKLLESKEVPLEKLSKVLCRGISCTNIETVREFVLKYEEENDTIPLHQWKEIFKALGYAEEFSGVVGHVVGQPHRHHGYPRQSSSDHYDNLSSGDGAGEDLNTESSLALSQPEASSVWTDDITKTTNPCAWDQRSGAIPKKHTIPQKHVEPDGKPEPSCAPCFDHEVSGTGLHVDEDESSVEDQMNVQYRSKELEERTIALNNCEVHIFRLQRELLDCRAKCASLEKQKQELIQIHQENHQMTAQAYQMLQWKEEECNRLKEMFQRKQEECSRLEEHIRESEVQYNNAITDMSAQRRAHEASEEVEHLRTLLRQFSLHPDCGAATYSDEVMMPHEENENVGSSEDESSNTSTSEMEIDYAVESPGSIQQSETQAPDECSDETRSSLKMPQRK